MPAQIKVPAPQIKNTPIGQALMEHFKVYKDVFKLNPLLRDSLREKEVA